MDKRIADVISGIKDFCGVDLTLCDYFGGVRELGDTKRLYFNVLLTERCESSSHEYNRLQKLVKKGFFKSIEPNGINRVSIFI